MAVLTKRQVHTPINAANGKAIIGRMERHSSDQAVAATLASDAKVNEMPGKLTALYIMNCAPAAASETMVIDVKKNGVSILSGTFTINTGNAVKGAVFDLLSTVITAGLAWVPGDIFSVQRTLTNGSTLTGTKVVAEIQPL